MGSNWIRVRDSVPADGRLVIVAVPLPRRKGSQVCTGHLSGGMWYGFDDFPLVRDPSHWMPMPDPPQEEEGEKCHMSLL